MSSWFIIFFFSISAVVGGEDFSALCVLIQSRHWRLDNIINAEGVYVTVLDVGSDFGEQQQLAQLNSLFLFSPRPHTLISGDNDSVTLTVSDPVSTTHNNTGRYL